MKIVARTQEVAGWEGFYPQLIAMDEGAPSEAVNATLLELITAMNHASKAEFDAILSRVEVGEYVPDDPAQADYCVNDIYVWVRPPEAASGFLLISNENVSDYSMDDGQPQLFPISSYRSARKLWEDYLRLVDGRSRKEMSYEVLQLDWTVG